MTRLPLIWIVWLANWPPALAQYDPTVGALPYRTSVKVGMDRLNLGTPTARAWHYQGQLTRYFGQGVTNVSLNIGGMKASFLPELPITLQGVEEQRSRFTTDLSVATSPFEPGRWLPRFGLGMSVWYRRDYLITSVGVLRNQLGRVVGVAVERDYAQQWNVGPHVLAELEYKPLRRLSITGRFQITLFPNLASYTQFGLQLGYHLTLGRHPIYRSPQKQKTPSVGPTGL